jgi:hypothetical protein
MQSMYIFCCRRKRAIERKLKTLAMQKVKQIRRIDSTEKSSCFSFFKIVFLALTLGMA